MREHFDPETIENILNDEQIVVYELVDNKDGSITIEASIIIYTKLGTFQTDRKMRLRKK